jgi:hypothetical protein
MLHSLVGFCPIAAHSLVVFANVHQCQLLIGIKLLFHFAEATFLDANVYIVDDGQESRRTLYENLSRGNYKVKELKGVAEDTRGRTTKTSAQLPIMNVTRIMFSSE